MATGAAVVAAVAVVASLVTARKGRKERARARKISEKRDRLKLVRQSAEQVRKAQIARQQVIQQAESTGVGDSSAVQGGLGSIQNQAASNIGFAQTLASLQQQIRNRLERSADFASNAQTFGQIGAFAASKSGSQNFAPVETSVPI